MCADRMGSILVSKIEVGDHVIIRGGSVHWLVLGIPELAQKWVYLRSGMTGRHRFERLRDVRLYKKGNPSNIRLARGVGFEEPEDCGD